MSKVEVKQFIKKRYKTINKGIVSDNEDSKLKGHLEELNIFAARFGVKLNGK